MSKGFITLNREILDHWISDDPIRFAAWVIILLSANHTDSESIIKGSVIKCKRGQVLYSLDTWATKFKMSKQQTRTFFKLLQKEQMINIEGLSKTTRLTVINYDSWQNNQHTDNTQITFTQHSDNIQITPSNNDNNDNKKEKNIKKRILTLKNYLNQEKLTKVTFIEKFIESTTINYPYHLIDSNFDDMLNWSDANAKTKADWYATLRTFLKKTDNGIKEKELDIESITDYIKSSKA